MSNLFAVPVFFVIFRETIESGIIVSVLLAFLKQTLGGENDLQTQKRLRRQVWLGVALGVFICVAIGSGVIGAFYTLKQDKWAANGDVWAGIFGLIATIIISVMGVALLRLSKLQDKWRVRLAKALEKNDTNPCTGVTLNLLKRWAERYAMFLLPFVTVMREGLEAVIFLGGVSVGQPASAFPLAAIVGLIAGVIVSYIIYRGAKFASIQKFLIISTCFLYLVAAGLFTRSVWYFEAHKWAKTIGGDALGSGPGSYDIRTSVWHVNCCNPEENGGSGWGVFNAILGWQNSATYGSVISYNVYWIAVILAFVMLRYEEKTGHWPFMKARARPAYDGPFIANLPRKTDSPTSSNEAVATEMNTVEKPETTKTAPVEVRSMSVSRNISWLKR